jgi:Zn-dependent protease with chaperone function
MPGERRSLILSFAALPFVLGILGVFLSTAFDPEHLALLVVGALVYVSLARGRLLGNSIRAHGGQFTELERLVGEIATMLDMPEPHVFVRDDNQVPLVAVGIGEPYSLVVSSYWLDVVRPEELRFLVARELAHIRFGHARTTSLLSVNGRENPLVSVAFGAYLRTTEYSADRVALLCTGSLDSAISAIAIATFHKIGRGIDLRTFAEQRREIDAEPTLRVAEWLSATPYATHRVTALSSFAAGELAAYWRPRFAEARAARAPVDGAQPEESGSLRLFPGITRRLTAAAIDYVFVFALSPQSLWNQLFPSHTERGTAAASIREAVAALPFLHGVSVQIDITFAVWLYTILLVTFAGRTIGMLVVDVRVVGHDLQRPSVLAIVLRYVVCAVCWLTVIPAIVTILRRVQPYDRLSRTRLVSANALRAPRPRMQPAG